MKKVLSLLLTVVLLMSVIPFGAFTFTASAATWSNGGYADNTAALNEIKNLMKTQTTSYKISRLEYILGEYPLSGYFNTKKTSPCNDHYSCGCRASTQSTCILADTMENFYDKEKNIYVNLGRVGQCMAFGNYCLYRFYGKNITTGITASSSNKSNATNFKNYLASFDDLTGAQFYVVSHSFTYLARDNNYIYFIDANSGGSYCSICNKGAVTNCKIHLRRFTYSDFINRYGTIKIYTTATSGTHTHNYSIHEYESAHPHKYYKKCSCGDFYYTGETAKVSNCPDCVDIRIQNTGIENITDTNAYLKSVIYKPASSSLQRIGVKIRREGKTYTEELKFYKIDTTTPSINKNQVELNWNLTNDCGYELIHATKYYYMMYAIIDGEKYWSEEASFTTTGSHIYSNACDTSCNDCGKTRTVPDHIYTDDFDESCNECDYVREIEKQYYYYDWTFDFDKTMRLLSDVTFNDGSIAEFMREFNRGQIRAIQVISGTEVVHPDAPERPGYKFTGWKILAEPGDSFYDITISDTYLQAQYEPLSCKDGEIPHSYTDIYDADCNECGEVRDVPNRDWQVSVNTTGVYNITPSKALSGFNKDSITVLDKNGKTVKYNNIKNGWPLVTGQNYTLKLNTEFENINDLSWNLTKNSATIFPDTSASGWYNDAVTYAVGAGIMSGYNNGKFGTSDSIQRQDFIVMLARLDGVDLDTYGAKKSAFSDVPEGSYFEAAVNWGVENGIVTGYNSYTFGVGDKVTREQLVTFLYRYAKYKGYDYSYTSNRETVVSGQYNDYKNVSGFAKDPILWAIEKGVISGKTSTTIAPQGKAQRCEVAKIMYNIYLNDIFK